MHNDFSVHPVNGSRRRFFQAAGLLSAAVVTAKIPSPQPEDCSSLPPAFSGLKPLGARVRPVPTDEFSQRIERAQQLMSDAAPKYDAFFFAPGTSLYYFTGIRWGLSERLWGLIVPRTGRIGIEEATGFTFFDDFRQPTPTFEYVSADPITIACRAHKSAHELELMRLACEATFDVFRATFASLKEGMSQDDIAHLVEAGFAKMNLHGGALVLLGASAALPHGTLQPQKLKEGDVVLIDGGCGVEGYASDVTRTSVYGKPTEKIARVYELVRKSQDAALEAARAGHFSGTVDDAARAVIVNGGFGPDYKFFTHRLGHGIGLDGHEHPYLVRGSKTILEPGMTFSNEPGIYVPGEFGLRCE